ncbi:hypothetical protein IID24_00715 [Patescibacteria group bacterium]|nr:hypothetical protein [Patescibacteria group bacterium]
MKFKIALTLILLTMIVGAIGFWSWQRNVFATDKVTLEILVPSEVTLADEITYVVKYKNNSSARLENVSLLFEYPEGSLPSDGGGLRVTQTLDDINPGQELSLRFIARLFGKKDEVREARAFLAYTPKNLSASFRSETTASTRISFVPLTFELDLPSRIEASQKFDFALNYFSNSDYPLSDLRVKIEYPEGFVFQDASPSPIGESEWAIAIINKADGGRIQVTGTLKGKLREAKLFRATVGIWRDGHFTLLAETVKGVELTSPNLRITQRINGVEDRIVSLGDLLHYEIVFRNVGDRSLENLFLLATLEGDGFDLETLKVNTGTFQQGDNFILWEAKNNPRLRFLGRGEEGRVEFWVNVRENLPIVSPQQKDFTLKNKVLVLDAKAVFETKINSQLTIQQAGYFADEVFGNSGSIPPKVGNKTTYTIIWLAKNLGNDTENVKVKALLSQGVKPTGKIHPAGAPLTFDSISREFVWEVGEMPSGHGVFDTAPSVAFQIEFTPNTFHKGNVVEIIGKATITGDDLFIGQSRSSVDEPIDTTLPDDQAVTEQQGVVQ